MRGARSRDHRRRCPRAAADVAGTGFQEAWWRECAHSVVKRGPTQDCGRSWSRSVRQRRRTAPLAVWFSGKLIRSDGSLAVTRRTDRKRNSAAEGHRDRAPELRWCITSCRDVWRAKSEQQGIGWPPFQTIVAESLFRESSIRSSRCVCNTALHIGDRNRGGRRIAAAAHAATGADRDPGRAWNRAGVRGLQARHPPSGRARA